MARFTKEQKGQIIPFELIIPLIAGIMILFSISEISSGFDFGRPEGLSIIRTSAWSLDDGNYTGLNGKEYNHHVIINVKRGTVLSTTSYKTYTSCVGLSTREEGCLGSVVQHTFEGEESTGSVGFNIAHVSGASIAINTKFYIVGDFFSNVQYSYNTQSAKARLLYDDKTFDSGLVSSNYKYKKDSKYIYLSSKPIKYSGNDDIYIESIGQMYFKSGCNYMNDYCFGDLRPPPEYNVSCIIAEKDYWIYSRKVWARQSGGQGESGSCDRTTRYNICYDSPIYASKEGECKAKYGRVRWDEDWDRNIFWKNYYYDGLIPEVSNNPQFIIAFNVPDSDGDGTDDLNDLAPNDPLISTIDQAKSDLDAWAIKLQLKQDEYDELERERLALEKEHSKQLIEIAKNGATIILQIGKITELENEINASIEQMLSINQRLKANHDARQEIQNTLAALQLQSIDLSIHMVDNIDELEMVSIAMDDTITNYEIKIMELEQELKLVDWTGQEDLRDNLYKIAGELKTITASMRLQQMQFTNFISSIKKIVKDKQEIEFQSSAKLAEMQSTIDEQEALLFEQEFTMTGLTKMLDATVEHVDNLQSLFSENQDRIVFLIDTTNKISALKDKEIQIQTELDDTRISFATAQERLRIINASIRELEIKAGVTYDNLIIEIEQLREDNKQYKLEIPKLQKRILELENRGATPGGIAWWVWLLLIGGVLLLFYWWEFMK